MYWTSILWLLCWPAIIALSFFLVKIVLKRYKEQLEKIEE